VTCYLASIPLTPHVYATAPSLQSYGSVHKDGSCKDGSRKDRSCTRKDRSCKDDSHLPRGINWCVEVQRRLAPAAPLLNTPLDADGVRIGDLYVTCLMRHLYVTCLMRHLCVTCASLVRDLCVTCFMCHPCILS